MTYVVAEAGQNHQGGLEVAASLIDMVAATRPSGMHEANQYSVDAVKFTKRDLSHECSTTQMQSEYHTQHSFGDTYGEHRENLELSDEAHGWLCNYAHEQALDFVETFCSPGCLGVLDYCTPDRLKVASRDLTNIPLLEALAETKIPIIISTGMGEKRDIDDALKVITRKHSDIAILHCLSQYPASYQSINLRRIQTLKKLYPYPIGYSDHSVGIAMPLAAVAMGATIIEKHVTLDRGMRGSDHEGSVERDGLWRMLRDIRNLEMAMGAGDLEPPAAANVARLKLERTCATSADLPAGTKITESDITLLSPGTGYIWRDRHKIIGRELTEDIPKGEILADCVLTRSRIALD